ncbi:hypothetical protein P378_01650 [Desulforamulus profundi]|uniref:Glycoside hydrolase family 13 N-terminal domain-containing protein n=1 Tax=Desulforamulus profundi TaxID=1383067 RepID=A0A2C6MJJ6_9FIRM|nr:hypothetical protein P378_01650 [Desulforamulus profundi]
MLGAHLTEQNRVPGVRFSLWAPNAREVRVVGDFNQWQGHRHSMQRVKQSGIWSLFVPGLKQMDLYKYEIHTHRGEVFLKADPYAFYSEVRPGTASRIFPWPATAGGTRNTWQVKKDNRSMKVRWLFMKYTRVPGGERTVGF